MGGNCSRDHPQSIQQPWTIPQSRRSRDSSLYTREPLGTGGYGLPRRFAPRNDSPDPLSFRGGPTGRRGNPSFLRWTGVRAAEVVGPYAPRGTGERHAESSCPTESPINHPGQRRTAERLRQRVRGRGGNRRKDHPKRGTAAATAQAALSEAESAERAAGQIRFLPDDLRVQHGVQCSEASAKPRTCSRRGCDN